MNKWLLNICWWHLFKTKQRNLNKHSRWEFEILTGFFPLCSPRALPKAWCLPWGWPQRDRVSVSRRCSGKSRHVAYCNPKTCSFGSHLPESTHRHCLPRFRGSGASRVGFRTLEFLLRPRRGFLRKWNLYNCQMRIQKRGATESRLLDLSWDLWGRRQGQFARLDLRAPCGICSLQISSLFSRFIVGVDTPVKN